MTAGVPSGCGDIYRCTSARGYGRVSVTSYDGSDPNRRSATLRPTSAISLVVGLLVAVAVGVLTVIAFVANDGGKPWHYWIAPVLSVAFAVLLVAMMLGYYRRVGRLEIKERRRGE